jgi:hypothetical protein
VIWLAFYRGRGTWVDRVIRVVTRSPYSHVEMILSPDRPVAGDLERRAFSSSTRDGGVRIKWISFDLDNWDFLPVTWADTYRIEATIAVHSGRSYDFVALLLSQFLNLRRGMTQRWFCSELIAWTLDLPFPSALSPGDLFAWVARLNQLHHIASDSSAQSPN